MRMQRPENISTGRPLLLRALAGAALLQGLLGTSGTQGADLLDDCEALGRWRPASGHPTPVLTRVEGPPACGGALRIVFSESEKAPFVGRQIQPGQGTPPATTWDQARGLSFWFKGDGADGFVTLLLIDESFTRRHAALVSLKSTHWRQVKLRWEDFVPEAVSSGWFGAPHSNTKPASIRAFWFGREAYLKPWTPCAFEVDEFRLERDLALPAEGPPPAPGLPRTLAKLKARQEVRIVALGDSVTYGSHVDERERKAYPARLEELLRQRFGYAGITVHNRGHGGLETRQGIVLIPRDVGALAPDLALVHFGYNDYTSMLSQRLSEDECRAIAAENFRQYVARIRLATEGKTEVLLIATLPGADELRHHAMDFFGTVASAVALEQQCAFSTRPRDAFQDALKAGKLETLFARLPNQELDVAHPNTMGHNLFAESLLKAFE